MMGVLTGFAVILVVIAAGYLAALSKVISASGRVVLSRVAFFVATPALMFTVVAESDPRTMVSPVIVTSATTAVLCAAVFFIISRLFMRRDLAATTLATSASGYVNANNIGLPVGIYVIGDITYVPPLILMQVVLFAPVIIAILEFSRGSRQGLHIAFSRALTNPIIIGTLLGLIVALADLQVPAILFDPLEQLGGAAIPMVLLAFGASLHGDRLLARGTGLSEVAVASLIKVLVAPAIAWVIAGPVLNLDAHSVFAAVVISALPTAQNMYNFAATYQKSEVVIRNIVFVTTFASLPVLLVIALLLKA